MNKVIMLGRITNDLELKRTSNGTSVLSFSIALNEKIKDNERTDFVNCVAWKGAAETISRYFKKGDRILIDGKLRTRTYTSKTNETHYVTEIYVDNFSFIETKKAETNTSFEPLTDEEFDELFSNMTE